jgi:ABC-2 type transport system permease protein
MAAADSILLPILTLVRRELTRFVRQRSRIIGAFVQPLLFWLFIGAGFRASFQPSGLSGVSYAEYVYPGIIAMVLLFTAIFSTISIVEDRRQGFLQGVLVAPVPRWAILLGQALGCTALAVIQGVLFLFLGPVVGVTLRPESLLAATAAMVLLALGLSSLGLIIAWRADTTQGFHAIMNLFLLPMWLLSGAVFPVGGVPAVLGWVMQINPMTYGLAAIRRTMYLLTPEKAGAAPSLAFSFGVTLLFSLVAFGLALRGARTQQP